LGNNCTTVSKGKQNFPYRTNCFEARSYDPKFPNVVFKVMNNRKAFTPAACLLIVYQCIRTHSPRSLPWPGL